MACRRRETSGTNASIFCSIFFSSSSSSFSSSFWDLCLSRSHIENQRMLLPVSRDDATGQIWGLYRSGKQIKPDPVSRDDVAAKIWGLYRSGKQTTPDPALRPSPSRYSDRHICNGAREQRFLISLNQTSPTKLSLNPQTSPLSPRSLKQKGSNQATKHLSVKLRLVRSGTLPEPMKKMTAEGFDLILLLTSPYGLGPRFQKQQVGPTRTLSKPIKYVGPIVSTNRPRSVLSSPSPRPLLLLSRSVKAINVISLSELRNLPWIMVVWFSPQWSRASLREASRFCLEDWKKAQVDSKKILAQPLAQPHQSAKANPSRQGADPESNPPAKEDWKKTQVDSKKILAQPHQSTTANSSRQGIDPESTPPARHCKGISEDILSIANLLQNLSFRFNQRSETIIADDLAKKAIWSMTSGPSMFYVTLCFI